MNTLLYWFINGELIYFFSMRVQANWIEFIFSNCIKQNRENDNMDENQYNVEEDILKRGVYNLYCIHVVYLVKR